MKKQIKLVCDHCGHFGWVNASGGDDLFIGTLFAAFLTVTPCLKCHTGFFKVTSETRDKPENGPCEKTEQA